MAAGLLVSTVIPVYNGERFLAEAIESALAQDYRPQEVIVVDDGSTDSSAAVAARYDEVRLLRQANGGPAAARNAGILAARGELVALLDADDLMAAGRLAAQVGALTARPGAACALGREELFVEPGSSAPHWVQVLLDSPERAAASFPPSSGMYRREALLRVGLQDVTLRTGEDGDLVFRMQEAGIPILLLDDVVIRRRFHDGNLTRDESNLKRGMAAALKRRIDRRRQAEPTARDA